MRDEFVSAIILSLLIALFVFNSVTIKKRTKSLINSIEKAEHSIYEENAEEKIKNILKKWEKEKKILFYICGHNIIMQVDENVNLGDEYIRLGDKERALYNLKKARILLDDLYEREKIRLDNIF